MPQEPKTVEQVREIVGWCHAPDSKQFRVGEKAGDFYLQIEYYEPDIRTGEAALQRGRKWNISRFATKSEIVQTCFAACMASAEHQTREHFLYEGLCPKCGGSGQALNDFAEYPSDGPPPCAECGGSGRGKPRAIFAPHFDSDALYSICGKRANYDAREDPE